MDTDALSKNRRAIQEYVAEEQPIIALNWGDAIYPARTDHWVGWTPMYGYGPVNYLVLVQPESEIGLKLFLIYFFYKRYFMR
jgi:hypothetical protein